MDWNVTSLEQQTSLPGTVKLPKRFQRSLNSLHDAAAPDIDETTEKHLTDLKQAIKWIKNELIQLRQHDLLLKHQFLNIQNTLQAMKASQLFGESKSAQIFRHSLADKDNESSSEIQHSFMKMSSSAIALNLAKAEENLFSCFQRRTSSTISARDLAAIARRRDSREFCL